MVAEHAGKLMRIGARHLTILCLLGSLGCGGDPETAGLHRRDAPQPAGQVASPQVQVGTAAANRSSGRGSRGDGADDVLALRQRVVEAGRDVPAPRLLQRVEPQYAECQTKGEPVGRVLLEILVDTEGRVGEVRPIRSATVCSERVVIEAVQRWRFEPTISGGERVWVRCTYSVAPHFR